VIHQIVHDPLTHRPVPTHQVSSPLRIGLHPRGMDRQVLAIHIA
jgi:hypothetical protein